MLLGVLGGTLPGASLAGEVVIESLEPARRDSILTCTLVTRGLPDAPSRETILSGLPSSLVISFTLLDESGQELESSRVEVRIEPDLWEDVIFIRTPFLDQKAESIEAVVEQLHRLGPLPVHPLNHLPENLPLQIRSRLSIYPLAPAEILRVKALFGGDEEESEPSRREVSVGIGSLMRFFLGGHRDEEWVASATSGWFTCRDLMDGDPK
ncbi:MAG: hypothetical protein KJ970_03230 [Candidatus Eisenbacteria bacterium]|uniref:DUF4390 domain-containing protein n=1 Tax=Eiseniibacteriota bacterium TaxID=2212470 RepID=A0A948RX92_UNCEI|nr:hypothetical protein [Candidatus Eisenbacteria bacterium]